MTEEENHSQAAEGKSPEANLAAAVIGGYVLGRTKKGGAALGLASWLSGNRAGPQPMALARKGLIQVAQSEQVAQIMQRIRGPLMDAAQKAVASQVTAISDGLIARMQTLGKVGVTTVEGTADTVKGAAGAVTDTTKKAVKGTADTTKKAAKSTASTVTGTTKKAARGTASTTKKVAKGTADTTKKTAKGTADTVAGTTKKAGGRVQGAIGRSTGKKEGNAEEPMAN
jgi:hypothetical protein